MQDTLPIRATLALSCALGAAASTGSAAAQTIPSASLPGVEPAPSISAQLPVQLPAETVETVTGPDGVETITRTRRIPARSPASRQIPAQYAGEQAQPQQAAPYPGGYYTQPYPAPTYIAPPAPAPVVFQREQWLDECRRRIAGRSDKDRSQILGGLLGAAVGAIAGNRIADEERLGGTLIGAGAGGLAGAAIGNALKGDDSDEIYSCEDALNNYLSQPAVPANRVAARTIPAGQAYSGNAQQGFYPYPVQYQPQYQPQTYTYQQPSQQVVWVPVQVEQPQRVIVRETVREEGVPARRVIPAPRYVQPPAASKLIRE